MNKKTTRKRKFIVLLSLILSLCICQLHSMIPALAYPAVDRSTNDNVLDAVFDPADAIHISTTEDLLAFAQNCSVDTWSKDKIFLLDNDLRLDDIDFAPIPSFGGVFVGQGHTISGLSLSGGSNHMGLFRYIQEDGAIYQLSVSGSVTAESSHSGLSLLAGVNRGVIGNCHVSGSLNGGERSGGIAGINESTGVIMNCSASGNVCGKHLIGGIAGENLGSISGSQNHCDVNIVAGDNNIDLSSIDFDAALTDILTTENAASVTDIGGITGSNSGIIRACVNDGSVGYPHVGYNIGGIAGSQSGYIEGCINYGALNGRKDIGGIAGQMEPSSKLQFDEDTLKKLNEEFHKLNDLLTKLDRDTSDSSSSLTGQIDQLLNSVEGAQNAVDNILTNASDDFSSFAEPTDLATLPSPKPISLDFLDALPTISISPSATPTENVSPSVTPTESISPSATPTPTVTPDAGATKTPTSSPDAETTKAPADDPDTGLDPTNAPDAASSDASLSRETHAVLPKPLYAPRSIQSMVLYDPAAPEETSTPFPWPEGLPTPSGDINLDDYTNLFEDIDREEVEKSINDAQTNIYEDASSLLNDIQSRIQNHASVIGSRFESAQNMLASSFSAIVSDTRLLNSMLDGENQIILDDFQAIIDELNVITDLITTPDPTDPDEILEDISDKDQITDTTGKVMNSVNCGLVNGDLNVGGIAGSLSRENNFDPENDFDLDQYDTTLNFRYQERIVIRQCKNSGKVEGKKNCIGGIAGEMLLGSIMECTNTGAIKSDGSQIGGIAGLSLSTIRESNSKCALWGCDKIGGIVGEGTTIYDCRSMIEIREGQNYLGSVAGITDPSGDVENCFFVEGCPAGIDGISYTGHAQPLPYQEFLELPELPELFKNIYLTFEADDRTVSTVTIAYGENFNSQNLPKVPPKEGYVGTWSDFNETEITFDQTIKAIYTEYITTLASDLTDDNRPILFVEGNFTSDDLLTVSEITAYPENSMTKAVCYKFKVSSDGFPPYTFRLLAPSDMENPQLEQLINQSWISIPAEKDGSYLVFTLDTQDAVVCCTERPETMPMGAIILLAILLAALLIVLILFLLRRRKSRKKH